MNHIISEIPIYWLPIWLLFSIGVSWWLYQKKGWINDISSPKRYLLIALRSLGLFFLGVLLLGLLIEKKEYRKEKPLLITIVDPSSSMLNYSDSLRLPTEAFSFYKELQNTFSADHEVILYPNSKFFDSKENILFSDQKSPLSTWIKNVYDGFYGRNIGAVVLVSDGNYNQGKNPVQEASMIHSFPIYTIGVGDTIQKKDILVNDVRYNSIAFLGNKFPIEVQVKGFEIEEQQKVKLHLRANGKELSSNEVEFSPEMESMLTSTFYVSAKDVGIVEYEIALEELDIEANYDNNKQSVFVEVLDARSKILLLAGAPHPDLGAIKNVLEKDENLEVQVERIENLPKNLDVYDLIVWHDPGVNTMEDQFQLIQGVKKPIWYIFGPNSDLGSLSKLNLPITLQQTGQLDEVTGAYQSTFDKFQFSEKGREGLKNLPPLLAHYGKLSVNGATDVLFKQQIGNVEKDEPLFFFGATGSTKYAFLFGEGIWQWKLSEYQLFKRNVMFEELVSKTVQYLSVRSDASRLKLKFPNNIVDDQELSIVANFYNESYEPITDAAIEFLLINQKGEETKFSFLSREKDYSLGVGRLPKGVYQWKAEATYNGETFHKQGSFVVRSMDLEDLDTKADHNLLFQIAEVTGGKFYPLGERKQIIEELNDREDIAVVSYESTFLQKIIDYWWIFFLIISFFTVEWVIRRYSGSY